jgi:hypothetical protein
LPTYSSWIKSALNDYNALILLHKFYLTFCKNDYTKV